MIISALALASCGSPASDEEAVEEAVHAYYGTIADGDWANFCASFTEDSLREIFRPGRDYPLSACLESPGVAEQSGLPFGYEGYEAPEIKRIDVLGDNAVVVFESDDKLRLVRTGDDWWRIEF